MPLTVIATLRVHSSARLGRRAAIRSPSSSGAGRRLESVISQAVRRGGRAVSLSARIVLVREARMAGMSVAIAVTPSATAVTITTVAAVNGTAPAPPISPALGRLSAGAARRPNARPAAAASSAGTRYWASSTAATRPGVPPTALSSPTRRI